MEHCKVLHFSDTRIDIQSVGSFFLFENNLGEIFPKFNFNDFVSFLFKIS